MASSRISSLLRVGLILLTLAILLATVAATLRHNTSSNDRSKLLTTATFVGRDSCKSCHESATAAWTGSHHDMAMDHATEQTVLGDFNAATFEQAGLVTRFFRRDGQFIVNTQGPDGQLHDYVVSYVFGFTPLQQYLIEFPGGRYQCLTIAWDTVKRKWYSLYPGENIPPGDPLHWTGRLQNWNRMCAQCHSTDVRKNYDIASGSYHTTWKEIDVSCEACHGPASHHVQWANASSLRRLFMGDNPRLVTDLKTSAAAQLDACFVCHSRRRTITDSYRHGEPWTDHFVPELLEANTYHADGQILDEVYEFGSYTQSLMYHRNIRCSDCHDPHSLRPLAAVDNNSLCIRCHEPAKFNSDAHLRHAPGTPGSRCIDCHMPTKTYMGVDVRRDHSIRIPRPDLTVQLGTPNACNQCHTDKTPQWAADHVVAWFGPVRRHPPDRPDDWAPAIAAARANTPDSLDKLLTMLADDRLPVIVRATGLALLRNYGDPRVRTAIIRALTHPDALVRSVAASESRRLNPDEQIAHLMPLLDDPARMVRIQVARVMGPMPRDLMPADRRASFDAAMSEYIASLTTDGDDPAAWLNLGVLRSEQGDTAAAMKAYEQATALDPTFVPVRMNLANLLNASGRNDEAEAHLRHVLKAEPGFGEGHYSMGLLLAENPARMTEAVQHLKRAADLLPRQPRIRYNLALALEHMGNLDGAAAALDQAHRLDPESRDILHALIIHHLKRQQWTRAMTYAQAMALLEPDNPDVRQLIADLQQRIAGQR